MMRDDDEGRLSLRHMGRLQRPFVCSSLLYLHRGHTRRRGWVHVFAWLAFSWGHGGEQIGARRVTLLVSLMFTCSCLIGWRSWVPGWMFGRRGGGQVVVSCIVWCLINFSFMSCRFCLASAHVVPFFFLSSYLSRFFLPLPCFWNP
ncbi:hypothetical protein VTJ04DRAFT_9948 [Mycothermus thermophilus]|uniref:uncharacterized protein n=1 Tax=Humicola insolens TaxID=85995 RepID=UPI003743F0F5